MSRSPVGGRRRERALVLGGGGLTGCAWMVAFLAELESRGFDASLADLIVGTSGGSIVGAQLAHGSSCGLVKERFSESLRHDAPRCGSGADFLELSRLLTSAPTLRESLAAVGGAVLARSDLPSAERLRAIVDPQLPKKSWPPLPLLVTAVDASTGEFSAISSASSIELVDAVTASCSLPFAYAPAQAAGRRWLDGFMRSPANADLATGYERALVVAPMNAGFSPVNTVSEQVAQLRDEGTNVFTVSEAPEIPEFVTIHRMEGAYAAPVMEMAAKQAVQVAGELLDFWSAEV